MLAEINYLSFGDPANMIQMEASLAFGFFGVDVRAYEGEDNQTNRENASRAQGEDQLPIGEQFFQLLPLAAY
jgi:hypothetical protein